VVLWFHFIFIFACIGHVYIPCISPEFIHLAHVFLFCFAIFIPLENVAEVS
jgi:hypothetical protein